MIDIVPAAPTSQPTDGITSPMSLHNNSTCESELEAHEDTPPRYRSLRYVYDSCTFALAITDPMSYVEAARQHEQKIAMHEELDSIHINQTWELTTFPKVKKAVGLKWVYKMKYHADGRVHKHKARLVVKGYSQREGVDFDEVFSPCCQLETVRTFLAIAAH